MCEFTMMDFEMELEMNDKELLNEINNGCFIIDDRSIRNNSQSQLDLYNTIELIKSSHKVITYIFEYIQLNHTQELEVFNRSHPFSFPKYTDFPYVISFNSACDMINKEIDESSLKIDYQEYHQDLSSLTEKVLYKAIKAKYNIDFYFVFGFPLNVRAFYTDSKHDNSLDNKAKSSFSFDAFIKGEEILSGAKRINDYHKLLTSVIEKGINPESISDYLKAFTLSCPVHGGIGVGVERILKLILDIKNVKECSMFPRDPKRIRP